MDKDKDKDRKENEKENSNKNNDKINDEQFEHDSDFISEYLRQKKQIECRCSFCGATKVNDDVKLIKGMGNVFICNHCIDSCNKLLLPFKKEEAKKKREEKNKELSLYTPKKIKEFLDEYVIGQDEAKKVLAVQVYNHYKRIQNRNNNEDNIELQKSNILMLGPSGSGKTYLAQTLAKILNVPFAIADATTLTQAGYVGDDVENILLKLIQAADYDVKKAEMGIIYIDEIDKISRKGENVSITRDVSGEGVQQSLLKILEGTVASVPPQGGRKHPNQDTIQINTKNILFICGGAFSGIEDIIEKRLDTNKHSIGFGVAREEPKKEDIKKKVQTKDLVKYGLIPELIGRIPVVVTLDGLDEEALIKILSEPKNSIIKQYQYLFKLDDVSLKFDDEALKTIAQMAIEQETGARGLRSIIETTMMNAMFEIPSDKSITEFTVTKDMLTA